MSYEDFQDQHCGQVLRAENPLCPHADKPASLQACAKLAVTTVQDYLGDRAGAVLEVKEVNEQS
jgi:hypothetical protein